MPATLQVLLCEVTCFLSFASVCHHDNFILHQNIIYCINDAKTWPRMNTAGVYGNTLSLFVVKSFGAVNSRFF